MLRKVKSLKVRIGWIFIAGFFSLSACTLSIPSILPKTPSQVSPQDLSAIVQTSVAGTMQAQEILVQASATSAAPPPAEIVASPTFALMTTAPIESLEPGLPPTPPPSPIPPVSMVSPQPYSTPKIEYQPFQLPITSPKGVGFDIKGFHLPSCGVNQVANFLLINTSSLALESAIYSLEDLSSSLPLNTPALSNTPFLESDRSCHPGRISQLPPGYFGYLNSQMSGAIRGNTIRASFLLCTEDNLLGDCFGHSIEFVLP